MIVFVADIHLNPLDAAQLANFDRWLRSQIERAERVYILGDLFNYWYSGLEITCAPLIATLGEPRVTILPGNRDFLLSNLKQLKPVRQEELPLDLDGKRLVLAHGHTLPDGDLGFKFLHAAIWPLLRLADPLLPLNFKNRLATRMVKASKAVRPLKAVIAPDCARRFQADLIVCGHLHRKITEPRLTVLPAFEDRGEFLVYDAGIWRFEQAAAQPA